MSGWVACSKACVCHREPSFVAPAAHESGHTLAIGWAGATGHDATKILRPSHQRLVYARNGWPARQRHCQIQLVPQNLQHTPDARGAFCR